MRNNQHNNRDRGQVSVLESVVAAGLIIAVIIFAIQATAITPLTISTSHQHIETQQKKMADGVLEHTKESGALKDAILYWDQDNQVFDGAGQLGFEGTYPDNEFGDVLNETFEDRRIAISVFVQYPRQDGSTGTEQMVEMGEPSDNAMTATTNVVIYTDDVLTAPGETETVEEADDFFAPSAFSDDEVYTVVEVSIVVWRI